MTKTQKIDVDELQILCAFWHRTRRQFLEMTIDDVHRRQPGAQLSALCRSGFIKLSYEKGNRIYALTPKGESIVKAHRS